MSVNPEDPNLSAPKPVVPSPAPTPTAPLTPPVAPAKPALKLPTPPAAGLRPPVAPAPIGAPALNKLPESPKFVSPMPGIEQADDSIPVFLPIVAGFAAAASIAFAILLYLKR